MALKNESLKREIEFRNRQNQMSVLDYQNKALFALHELNLVQAKTEKLKAETKAINVETTLKAIERLKEIGVNAVPVMKNGELVGVCVASDKQ